MNDDRPGPSKATRAPAFLNESAAVVLSSARDMCGQRVLLVTWHQGQPEIRWSGQMELSTLDVERLRDFCSAWLALVPPEPEPKEAA